MISIERTRELLPEATKELSDEEVAEIRDTTQMLVELIFDQWMEDRKSGKILPVGDSTLPEGISTNPSSSA